MSTLGNVEVETTFIRYHNAPHKTKPAPARTVGVLLNNGKETKFFGTTLPEDSFSQYSEDEKVVVTIELDVFNDYSKKVTAIRKA